MNKIILASVALLGLAGVAGAQEVPDFYGQNPYGQTVDGSQVSVSVSGQASASLTGADGFQINQNENYSGR